MRSTVSLICFFAAFLSVGLAVAESDITISDDTGLSRPLSLPSQDGQSGKFLTTNGTAASWSTIGTGDFLKNGSVAMTGDLLVNAQKDLRLKDADSSNYAAIQAPSTISADYTLTLPANDGNSGQFLQTNGSGVLVWAAPSGAGLGDFMADGSIPMTGALQFGDADASNFISIQPPSTVSADYTLTLPANDGADGEVLSTNGSGVLAWIEAGGSFDPANMTADLVFDEGVSGALKTVDQNSVTTGSLTLFTGQSFGGGQSGAINLTTGDSSGQSGNIKLQTGSANSGPAGNIILHAGGSGAAGAIKFIKEGAPSAPGEVWTASGTDGTGYWAAASGGGADTDLSNLTTTAVNETLNMAATKTVRLPHNVALTGRNSGDTADKKLIASSGDGLTVGDEASYSFLSLGDQYINLASTDSEGAVLGNIDINTPYINFFGDSVAEEPVSLYLWSGDVNGAAIIKAPDVMGADYTLTLPADAGVAGQFLKVDASGNLSFGEDIATPSVSSGDSNTIDITTGNSSASTENAKSGDISLLTGNTTGTDPTNTSGRIDLQTGASIDGFSGAIQLATGESEYQSGDVYLKTGNGLVDDDAYTGSLYVWSGNVTGTARPGEIQLKTGDHEDGDGKNISLVTGTPSGTGARGTVVIDANALRLPSAAADPTGIAAGDLYYNTVSNKLRFYNGAAWETVTSVAD